MSECTRQGQWGRLGDYRHQWRTTVQPSWRSRVKPSSCRIWYRSLHSPRSWSFNQIRERNRCQMISCQQVRMSKSLRVVTYRAQIFPPCTAAPVERPSVTFLANIIGGGSIYKVGRAPKMPKGWGKVWEEGSETFINFSSGSSEIFFLLWETFW